MAVGSWIVSLSSRPSAGFTLGNIAAVLIGLGLGVGAVMLIPITRTWLRWIVNPVILLVPILVALELLVS